MEEQTKIKAPKTTVINSEYGTITEVHVEGRDPLDRFNYSMVYDNQSAVYEGQITPLTEQGMQWREIHLANKMVIRGTGPTLKIALQNSTRLYLQVQAELTKQLNELRIKMLRAELQAVVDLSDDSFKERLHDFLKLKVWREPNGYYSSDHPGLMDEVTVTLVPNVEDRPTTEGMQTPDPEV